ncbi:uncharacterized protein EV422DRAFT_334937 [Fimicolochytrium jonesii]|uniref:uncharacterized protein n=1 Tax=Fimicolochytrium jonesii TaxID=1396493 RepID=UPI0022FE5D9E|nr:uncharacterized protein EV422DRAFT_334937 [Fimicolochytrium jonesii]KAI8816025.1 hypothetical protein EV422DRAFT_334937 [Fimicolochytrium jonesii]
MGPILPLEAIIGVVRAYYVFATFFIVVLVTVPYLRRTLLAYGKATADRSPPKHFSLEQITVRKSWFWHFYALGLPWTCTLLFLYLKPESGFVTREAFDRSGSGRGQVGAGYVQPPIETVLALAMMVAQTGRRLYENFYVHVPSEATMHVAHYVHGLAYYFLTPIAVGIEGWRRAERSLGWTDLRFRHVCGIALFAYGWYEQHLAHVALADLRIPGKKKGTATSTTISTRNVYAQPKARWFKHVSSPHYFFEMVIYLSFCVLTGFENLTSALVFGYVVISLGIEADQSWRWYKAKFADEVPRNWKRFIPFVL